MNSSQAEYLAGLETRAPGSSQCDLILARLKETPGEWVPMPELYRVSGAFAVHSRISDLRKLGFSIAHKNERTEKATHSFYKLEYGEQP